MSDLENAMRLISTQTQIPRWKMRKDIYEETYNQLMASMAELAQLQIAFDIKTKTVEDAARQTKLWVQNKGLSILYVDYLQLLGSKLKYGSRAEAVAAVSRGLKEIAMDNNIPVVALSQFRRGTKDVPVEELLEYLKESSGIEQDASTVTYIQIDNGVPDATIKPAKLVVLKNRNGATFTPVMLDYRGETFTFSQQVSFEELSGEAQATQAPVNNPDDVIPF
jgi:replicative DNA helicase